MDEKLNSRTVLVAVRPPPILILSHGVFTTPDSKSHRRRPGGPANRLRLPLSWPNAVCATHCRASRSPRMRRRSARTPRGPTSLELLGPSSNQPRLLRSCQRNAPAERLNRRNRTATPQRLIDDVLISFFRQFRTVSAEHTLSRTARERTLGGVATYP